MEYERIHAGIGPQDDRAAKRSAEREEQIAGMRDTLRAPSRLITHGGIITPVERPVDAPARAAAPVTLRSAARPPVRQAAPARPALAPSPSGRHADAIHQPVQRAARSQPLAGDVVPLRPVRKAEPSRPVQPSRPANPPPLRPAATAEADARNQAFVNEIGPSIRAAADRHGVVSADISLPGTGPSYCVRATSVVSGDSIGKMLGAAIAERHDVLAKADDVHCLCGCAGGHARTGCANAPRRAAVRA